MKKLKLTFFSDAGHGWLRVPLKVVKELGIEEDISPYSYMSHKYAYLEEDSGRSMFLSAAEGEYRLTIKTKVSDRAACRDYPRFNPKYVGGITVGDKVTLYTGEEVEVTRARGRYFILSGKYKVEKSQIVDYLED